MTEKPKPAKEVAALYEVEPAILPQPLPTGTANVDRTAQGLKAQLAKQGVSLSDRDLEVLQAYLASEQKWESVYQRLADA